MPSTLESPERSPSPAMSDFDSTFGSDLEPAPAPTPAPTPEPTTETPKPDETQTTRQTPPKDPETGKFTKETKQAVPGSEGKGIAKSVEEPAKAPPDKPQGVSEFEPPQVAKPNELRNYARKMAGRAQQAEQSISQLRAELNQLKSNPQQSVDTKALTEELASAKKRLEEYEGEIKATRYERSQEYKDKYLTPYQNALQSAQNEVKELLVTVPNPSDPENPQERPATSQDFDEVYSLPIGQAVKLAKAKFGDAASIVIQHVKAIKDASRAAITAVQSHQGQAEQYEQQSVAQKRMIEEGRNRMFTEALQGISQKHPDLFDVKDGDTEWNTALEKGRGMADLAFGDRSQLTPAQSTILDAHIFSRVSSYPAVLNAYRKSAARIAALEKEVSELRGSSPGKPSASAPKPETGDEKLSMEQAFDKFVP